MALSFPDDCRYAESHEFVRVEGERARIGLSAYAIDQLGDIVFVELPEPGATLTAGETFGTVESVKAVEELVAPLGGTVEARNEALIDSPDELQNDPYGEGWLLVVRPDDAAAASRLMDADTYRGRLQSP
jgi:glycine cleavage system H protein